MEFRPPAEGFHRADGGDSIDGRFAGALVRSILVFGEMDLKDTFAFQLDMESAGCQGISGSVRFRYPASPRDLAIVVDASVPAAEGEMVIRRAAGEYLESVTLFDVYTGEQVGNEKKSLAYSLIYRAKDRTLTDEEVAKFHQTVVDELERIFGARLRA